MAEKNLKKAKHERMKRQSRSKTQSFSITKKKRSNQLAKDGRRKKSGPHLPSSFLKELGIQKPTPDLSDQDEMEESDDLYEYEEALPEEETKKNQRFDPVENYEYELPADFEDEDVPSDEDEGEADEEQDDENAAEKHTRMLQSITGLPAEAFKDKEKKDATLLDVQGDIGGEKISINDLLDPLQGKAGYSKLRKRLHQFEKTPVAVHAPLPKVERDKLERKVAYEQSKKEITKWEPLVKRNREAPTLYLGEEIELGVHTVGTIAAEHKPRTEFEMQMAELMGNSEIMEAHNNDGARLLELNKVSIADAKHRQNSRAKLRSLILCNEAKAKAISNIKSKTYHRILKKERHKIASMDVVPKTEMELAAEQEFKRAEERMTLKHRNSSRWAKRILKRGFKAQDEGSRAAIANQLQQHALLTRKINSMNENSSGDETSDDFNEDSLGSDGGVSELLIKAKEKTLKVMEENDEIPKSGVYSLPFMERSLKKQREAAHVEGRRALLEYEASLGKLGGYEEGTSNDKRIGRRVFAGGKEKSTIPSTEERENYHDTDSEGDIEIREEGSEHRAEDVLSALFPDDEDTEHEALYKKQDFDDIIRKTGPKATLEVAIFSSEKWTKMKAKISEDNIENKSAVADYSALQNQKPVGHDDVNDSDSETEMVDGLLSSLPKSDDYSCGDDLINHTFAGDDAEMEFEKEKMDVLNEENPEPEKPVLLPGWGQWTHIQKKKGIPSAITEEYEKEKRRREATLKTRKDALLKNVIISERIDKKAEKLLVNNLPFPYTSKEVYEQSIRMPIGPDYNPAISIGALNRPAVVKRAGVIITPIKYEDIDLFGKCDDSNMPKQSRKKQKQNAKKMSQGSKATKKSLKHSE